MNERFDFAKEIAEEAADYIAQRKDEFRACDHDLEIMRSDDDFLNAMMQGISPTKEALLAMEGGHIIAWFVWEQYEAWKCGSFNV